MSGHAAAPPSNATLDSLLPVLTAAAAAAGQEILRFYRSAVIVDHKVDASPVTEADRAAERILCAALAVAAPDIPVIAEESYTDEQFPSGGPATTFWLVDPLDGTREFIAGRDEFTVNIGLVTNGVPIFGIVHLPARAETFWGNPGGAFHQRPDGRIESICVRPPKAMDLTAVASRSHRTPAVDAFLRAHSIENTISAGSSLKFCLVAMAAADVYPRFGPTMEWDTAAGHAVLAAAGGRVLTTDNAPLRYGKPGYRNPDFIAWGGDAHLIEQANRNA